MRYGTPLYVKELRFNELVARINETLALLKEQDYSPVVTALPNLEVAISYLRDKYLSIAWLCDTHYQDLITTKEKAQLALAHIETSFNQFINSMEIKKNARILGIISKDPHSPFYAVPPEITLSIVRFGVFSERGLTEKESFRLAETNFTLALLKS